MKIIILLMKELNKVKLDFVELVINLNLIEVIIVNIVVHVI